MKIILIIVAAIVLALSSFGQGRLYKESNPTKENAREFFNWQVTKHPILSTVQLDEFGNGVPIEGFSEFRSSKGHSLHVGNATYTPAQPLIAYDKVTTALDTLNLDYKVSGVGSFDNDRNIFAQFDTGQSGFSVNGKDYKGLITMAKGNDEGTPLSVWLTIICIVCANTFRAALRARRGNDIAVVIKQTKNSGARVDTLVDQIVALFAVQESVAQTLNRMAKQAVSLNQAERAFLGLLKTADENGKVDLSKTGKTRLANDLERYMAAFKDSPGTSGKTREDWVNAVTFTDTHGNKDSKRFDPDKQFISSEFGSRSIRKERAFALAANTQSFDKLIVTGEDIMQSLMSHPVVVSTATPQTTEFAKLLEK